ncbi:hypothetical protein [Lysobacter sp. GCM10012299]|uniref:hypothetical protein n=1 Tax=Lysobacter sp. GCM10012299 TaxID=3317333 RepID=UPI0036152A08
MSSGGGKSTTTVQNSGPPQWSVGSFQNLINQANQVANQPYQAYGGQRIAGFTGDQQAAQDMIRG